jgi:hypothetical protein
MIWPTVWHGQPRVDTPTRAWKIRAWESASMEATKRLAKFYLGQKRLTIASLMVVMRAVSSHLFSQLRSVLMQISD